MNFSDTNSSDLLNIVYLSLLLTLLASSVLFKSHLKASELAKQALWWSVIILVILVAYSFRYDFYRIKDRLSAELFPSRAVISEDKKISISAANDGHFYIDINVNSKPVRFMVDTGASDTTLNLSDARRVGIDPNRLTSFRRYQTANGTVFGGLAVVEKMEIAGIEFDNVTVSVNSSNMGTSLLGMNFLNRFDRYEFYQDRLVLTAKAN
ncbi:MAG: Transporter [Rickettsiaceae bacterium]|jgi:aspartyl protease family protein|nr:Transporter [Rickettsiaceae bacterium]